jgi:hypothetical protein
VNPFIQTAGAALGRAFKIGEQCNIDACLEVFHLARWVESILNQGFNLETRFILTDTLFYVFHRFPDHIGESASKRCHFRTFAAQRKLQKLILLLLAPRVLLYLAIQEPDRVISLDRAGTHTEEIYIGTMR